MEKIIRNLITNAVKFSPYGGNVTIRFLACLEPRQEQEEATADLLPQPATEAAPAPAASPAAYRAEVMAGRKTQTIPTILVVQSGLGLWICEILAAFQGGRMVGVKIYLQPNFVTDL